MADDWEYAYFNSLSHNGAEDSDGDDRSDGEEYRAGTSPVSGESVLRVFTLRRSGAAGVQVLWAAVPGKIYGIQRRDSLADAAWQDVGSVRALTSTADWTDVDPSVFGQRYYRVFVME
ncbi:MAG: hypothetical protein JNN07_05205 [Verrucomicrobiales bacterium]|nr:hypothetical protein [Verrucomicrobiales bacterium]